MPRELLQLDLVEDVEPCVACEKPGGVVIESVRLDDATIQALQKAIYACEERDCAQGDGANCTVGDALLDCVPSGAYGAVLTRLLEGWDYDDIEWPGLGCPSCGAELEGWWTDVLTRVITMLPVDRLPDPPEEITQLPKRAPAAAIEWWRADCSTYLVHLTRGAPVATSVDNIDFEAQMERFSAPQILWLILSSQRLRAARGPGMMEAAVCFTEKPLAALKETVLGEEFRVRRGRRALQWPGYGVMFDKEYLRDLGVRPAIHVDAAEKRKLPPELAHRAVTFGGTANWLHEREWRSAADVVFDLERCIVLVPTFDQIDAFRGALEKRNARVRGFLPLHDVFAAL